MFAGAVILSSASLNRSLWSGLHHLASQTGNDVVLGENRVTSDLGEIPKDNGEYLLPVGFDMNSVPGRTTNLPIRDIDSALSPKIGATNVVGNQLLRMSDDYNPVTRPMPKPVQPTPNPEDLKLKPPIVLKDVIRTNANSG